MQKRGETKSFKLFQYVVIVLMIGAAFWTGTLFQQVRKMKQEEVDKKVAGAETGDGQQVPTEAEVVVLSDEQWQEVIKDPAAEMGEEGAKVTMVEMTDFECPFCSRAYEANFSQLKEKYIDTGKIRYMVRDLPLEFHANAKPAAMAARCAGDQGKYFEMEGKLYLGQADWSEGDPGETFDGYAKEIGLNMTDYKSCYEGEKFSGEIEADLDLAGRVGATGTPTFFVNGKKIVGAQPVSVFEAAIKEALGE